jgi:hypothetical protein
MKMNRLEFWIKDGCLARSSEYGNAPNDVRDNLSASDIVKIETSEAGTTIKWSMFAPNWASLFFAQDWIASLPGPYLLNFFNAGWFKELCQSAPEASARIGQLVSKSDIRLSARAYTRTLEPSVRKLPSRLRTAWEAGAAPAEASVVCSIDPVTGLSRVETVGAASAIASIWCFARYLPVHHGPLLRSCRFRCVSRCVAHAPSKFQPCRGCHDPA